MLEVGEREELAAVIQEPRKWGERGEELSFWMIISLDKIILRWID